MGDADAFGINTNLTTNLREVVARAPSVAEFCRLTGINRQQFNKYLAGSHAPSRRSIMKIATQCGLATQDFLLAPDLFLKHLEDRGATAPPRVLATHFQMLETFARNSVAGLKPFLGSYFRYHYSSIYPGAIIRAVTVIYQSEDIVRYVTVEHLPVADGSNTERYGFTYRGVCYMMGSRIFMCDFEHKQQNEMTSTILMPQFRTPIRYMFGLLTGIAATTYGQPFATRVAFERKNDDSVIRKAMVRQATMLQPNDPQIPANVINYIGIGEGTVLLAST